MRVHGTFKVKRRTIEIKKWENHKAELVEDFGNMCGYCGKHFQATLCKSQIDHFIPKKKYPMFENQYNNLVLACKVCNNKKRADWPSEDPSKNITEDNKRGYIDPASDEFDNHLQRNEDGCIIGKTDVGKYMEKRLGFDYRPISEIHKIKELYDSITLLREKKNNHNPLYDPYKLVELFETCEDLRQQIHMNKE